jgi:hypothetical protein
MNMVEEHDHLSNHWLEEKGMNITSIHMVEDMIKKRPSNHRSEDRGKNFVRSTRRTTGQKWRILIWWRWLKESTMRH